MPRFLDIRIFQCVTEHARGWWIHRNLQSENCSTTSRNQSGASSKSLSRWLYRTAFDRQADRSLGSRSTINQAINCNKWCLSTIDRLSKGIRPLVRFISGMPIWSQTWACKFTVAYLEVSSIASCRMTLNELRSKDSCNSGSSCRHNPACQSFAVLS